MKHQPLQHSGMETQPPGESRASHVKPPIPAFLKPLPPTHVPAPAAPSPTVGSDLGSGTPTPGSPPQPLKSQFWILPKPDTSTHPGGDLIHRVAPWVSLRLCDSVETGQVGTPLPGRGHPPAASAAAACRGPSGQPGAEALRAPQTAAERRPSSLGAVAPPRHLPPLCFRVGREASGSDRF